MSRARDIERFWAKVDRSAGAEACWPWTGFVDDAGYGHTNSAEHGRIRAHRLSFALNTGPLVPGLYVDHICRNKRCVNPAHLRQVTPRENALENSVGVTAANATKTHCKHGHELSGSNLRMRGGWRQCKRCQAIFRRERGTLISQLTAA